MQAKIRRRRRPDKSRQQRRAESKKQLRRCRRRIRNRLKKKQWADQRRRLFKDRNIHYEIGSKTRGVLCGGLGAVQFLVQKLEFADQLDSRLHLLKRHVPYFESDHVLNMTYYLLAGGKCLQDLELLRNQETYLNLLGAQRIPDPTTEGDFLRRFHAADVETLMDVINDCRVCLWQQQAPAFFDHAIIEADGTIAETTGACKEGMDISYDGKWGYHPLLVSLANTQEPLFLHNRPASRPSHEQAATYLDRAHALCKQAGFRTVSFRGDTDFSQTQHLDRWHAAQVRFVFGMDALPNLVALADAWPADAWAALVRPPGYVVKTQPRQRPDKVKAAIVKQKGYQNLVLVSEQVAAFSYRPGLCQRAYRLVVLRKNLRIEQGGVKLRDEIRYFSYITNELEWMPAQIVAFANDRCNQRLFEKGVQLYNSWMSRTPYPSDLTDAQWQLLEPLLPSARPGGRPRSTDLRAVVNAIFYVNREGCTWRAVPHDFPPWRTVYEYFAAWKRDGTWERINGALRRQVRVAAGRAHTPTTARIDSQTVKATETADSRGYDGAKKLTGRKRHIAVDSLGLLLTVAVTTAAVPDAVAARTVLASLTEERYPRLRVVRADSAYGRYGLPAWVQRWGHWVLQLVKRPVGVLGFVLLPQRWVVERTFAWLGRYRRQSRD